MGRILENNEELMRKCVTLLGLMQSKLLFLVLAAIPLTVVIGGCQKPSHGLASKAQTDAVPESLLNALEEFVRFSENLDAEVISLMIPEIVEMAGGAAVMESAFETTKGVVSIKVDSYGVLSDVLEVGENLAAECEINTKLKFKNVLLTEAIAQVAGVVSYDFIDLHSVAIAISRDKGKSWMFSQSSGTSRPFLDKLEPEISDRFPARQDRTSVNGKVFIMGEALLKLASNQPPR